MMSKDVDLFTDLVNLFVHQWWMNTATHLLTIAQIVLTDIQGSRFKAQRKSVLLAYLEISKVLP